MFNCQLLIFFFAVAFMGLSPAVAQDASADSGAGAEARHFKRKKCWQFGNCGGFQGGGYQGGYQGYPGQPPISIAISQSQSGTNGAHGGYTHGQYPNNYQYNGGYPNQGYYGGYPNQGYYGGYPNQGYHGGYPNQGYYGGYPNQGGFGPGYHGNGNYNNFNGNYYGPGGPNGYGFQRPPFGPYYDENADGNDNKPEEQDVDQNGPDSAEGHSGYNQGNDYNQGHGSVAGAFAFARRNN